MKNIVTIILGFMVITAQAQTASSVNCDGCVGTKDLANVSVSTAKLKRGAVTTPKIKNGAIKGKNIAADQINARHVRDGSITQSKVVPALKNDIDTACPDGQVVVGKDQGGRFLCEATSSGGGRQALVVLDSNDTELPFIRDELDGNAVEGWLEVEGGLASVVIQETRIWSGPTVYSNQPDCSGDLYIEYRDPAWVSPKRFVVVDSMLYEASNSDRSNRVFAYGYVPYEDTCWYGGDNPGEIDSVPLVNAQGLPYSAPYRVEYR